MNRICLIVAAMACLTSSASSQARWTLVQEWQVGGAADGPGSFDYVLDIRALPHGGFVAYDWKSPALNYLDSMGRPVRVAGRRGSGPGEFVEASGIAVTADGRVIVNDRGNGRFTLFSEKGDFLRVVGINTPRSSLGARWESTVLNDGRLLDRFALLASQKSRLGEWDELVLAWSADLARHDTIPRLPCDSVDLRPTVFQTVRSNGQRIADIDIPFAKPTVRTAYHRSGVVWRSLNAAGSEIVLRQLGTCKTLATVRLTGPRVATTSDERTSGYSMLIHFARQTGSARQPTFVSVPALKPLFEAMTVDDAGNLWVERPASTGTRTAEVFASDGRMLGRIDDLKGLQLTQGTVIKGGRIVGLRSDRDGVKYLVSFRIVEEKAK